jgi:hypothetical protein
MKEDPKVESKGITDEMQKASTDAFGEYKRSSDDCLGVPEVARLLHALNLDKYMEEPPDPEPEAIPETDNIDELKAKLEEAFVNVNEAKIDAKKAKKESKRLAAELETAETEGTEAYEKAEELEGQVAELTASIEAKDAAAKADHDTRDAEIATLKAALEAAKESHTTDVDWYKEQKETDDAALAAEQEAKAAAEAALANAQVRTTPSGPRSWANFSPFTAVLSQECMAQLASLGPT